MLTESSEESVFDGKPNVYDTVGLDDRAVLTLEDMVILGKIGGNVVRQLRALEKILLGWAGTDDL